MIQNIDSIQTLGDVDMTLPSYMNSLKQEEIDVIRKKGQKNRVIACGYRKKMHTFTLINDEGSISEIDVKNFFQHFIIIDRAFPISCGEKIEVHTPLMIIEIDAVDLLSASIPINMSNFEIDMKS